MLSERRLWRLGAFGLFCSMAFSFVTCKLGDHGAEREASSASLNDIKPNSETEHCPANSLCIIIFPNGLQMETYLLELDEQGVLTVLAGKKTEIGCGGTKFDDIVEKRSVLIQDSDYYELMAILGNSNIELPPKDDGTAIRKGGWSICVEYNGNIYNGAFDGIGHNSLKTKLLLDKLLPLSPINIEIHSWS